MAAPHRPDGSASPVESVKHLRPPPEERPKGAAKDRSRQGRLSLNLSPLKQQEETMLTNAIAQGSLKGEGGRSYCRFNR
jgi:hypothetical protein